MKKIITFWSIFSILLSGCNTLWNKTTASESQQPTLSGYWVDHTGDRRNIIHHGDLSARIDLNTLAGFPNLYAIGPVTGLQGEVTIYDGVPSISTIVDGKPKVDASFGHGAIFLAYANSPSWQSINVLQSLESLGAIEAFVKTSAIQAGIALDKSFPFRIEGIANKLVYHIIFKTDGKPHNKAEHKKAKRKFYLKNTKVEIIGFWAGGQGEGVFTHPGKKTHLHFRLPDNSTSGHIDAITMPGGSQLYLPEDK